MVLSERDQQISPIVPESVIHNTKILSNIHSLSASLFGVGAGILGLEGWSGFIFYILLTLLTTSLLYVFRVAPYMSPAKTIPGDGKSSGRQIGGMQTFFQSPIGFWTGGLLDGASGFVLTWTLFYGLVRA